MRWHLLDIIIIILQISRHYVCLPKRKTQGMDIKEDGRGLRQVKKRKLILRVKS